MSQALWGRDDIQFPRLLCELVANNYDIEATARAMGVGLDDVDQLLERAHEAWEAAKKIPQAHVTARQDLRELKAHIVENAVRMLLDEMVHDMYSNEASNLNNLGMSAQVCALYEGGYTLESYLSRAVERKSDESPD